MAMSSSSKAMLLDAKVTLAAVVVDEPNVKNTRRSLFGSSCTPFAGPPACAPVMVPRLVPVPFAPLKKVTLLQVPIEPTIRREPVDPRPSTACDQSWLRRRSNAGLDGAASRRSCRNQPAASPRLPAPVPPRHRTPAWWPIPR